MAITVPDRDDWFDATDGLPRPNWPDVNGWMRAFAGKVDLDDAWQQFVRHWIGRLRRTLGGNYATAESENFHLLSEEPSSARLKTLAFLEATRVHIYRVLGDVASPDAAGKHCVLRFGAADDYYKYISHFYPEGDFAGSAGMFLSEGYYHIAYPESWSPEEERRTLAHELSHDLLVHLPLPMWLNEALAMAFEADLAGTTQEPLSREDAERHRAYWNAETIQQFWRGESFSDVDGQELSYSLSRVLLHLIHTEIRPPHDEFRRFVLRAASTDAGAIAAREHLEIELEDLAAAFLGPGEWRPVPNLRTPNPAAADPAFRGGFG